MSRKYSPGDFIYLLKQLDNHQEAPNGENPLDPQLSLLRQWQSGRLKHTYSDLLADKRYRPACEFFLNDVYAPRDFSRRDQDAEQLYISLSKYLPEVLLTLLADVIKMNQLSNTLDASLLQVLKEDPGVIETITPELYTQAYLKCNNYTQRKDQINLLVHILKKAGKGARHSFTGVSLRLAAIPARQTGWTGLYQFLIRGYQASRPMIDDLHFFTSTIQLRELTILDKIFDGDPNPFQIQSEIRSIP